MDSKILEWYLEIDLETFEEEIQGIQHIPLLLQELESTYKLVRYGEMDKHKAIRLFDIVRKEVVKRLQEFEGAQIK